MIVKQANTIISLVGRIFHFLIIFYVAVLLGKFVWWIFTPSDSDIYVEKTSINAFDKSGEFIINRSPFGVVLAPPVPPRPTIASEMKLTGLYFNTPENSIAFYEYNHKSYIAKIGDTIGGTATLKSISAKGIVITENNVEADVNMTGGGGAARLVSAPNGQTANFLNPQTQVIPGSEATLAPQVAKDNDAQSNSSDSQTDSLAERRRKLIEEFERRNQGNSGNNGNGNSGNSNSGVNNSGNGNNP